VTTVFVRIEKRKNSQLAHQYFLPTCTYEKYASQSNNREYGFFFGIKGNSTPPSDWLPGRFREPGVGRHYYWGEFSRP
jgi:hypothetical protein